MVFVLCDDHLLQQTLRHMFAMIVGKYLRYTAGIIDNQVSILFYCRVLLVLSKKILAEIIVGIDLVLIYA